MVFLLNFTPYGDVGLAIVAFTILVKFAILPLSRKAIRAQVKIKELEPKINEAKKTHENNKQLQAERIMAIYKENNVNPFSGFLLILIQLPIIFALYFIFLKGGLPGIDTALLYQFVNVPDNINVNFLGLIDISGKSLFLAAATGLSQFFQIRFSIPEMGKRPDNASFMDDLGRSMHIQMKYVMPAVIAVFAYNLSAFVALYWTTSNLFAIIQEIVVRRNVKKAA